LPQGDLLTRLRRDQSVAVAGRIAEIAPARAGHTVHAVAEARRPAFGRQLFHRRGRRTSSAAGGGEARLGRKADERKCNNCHSEAAIHERLLCLEDCEHK
jgi:hypothetical protein